MEWIRQILYFLIDMGMPLMCADIIGGVLLFLMLGLPPAATALVLSWIATGGAPKS